MARLRVFVSSTYYDLKHVRSALELTVEGMGHEAILFERGNVMFDPTKPLDESCYSEMDTADIAVLIIGGRYGSEVSETKAEKPVVEEKLREFDSITRREHAAALSKGIPIYTFIEKGVQAEYRTFLKNKGNDSVAYAHVDSINVFSFIESIESLGSNNVIQGFERASDIERWLKEQWSGLFRDLLKRRQEDVGVRSLSAEVERLRQAGKTLEKYLEEVLRNLEPEKAETIISDESRRREEFLLNTFKQLEGLTIVSSDSGLDISELINLVPKARDLENLLDLVEASPNFKPDEGYRRLTYLEAPGYIMDFNVVRSGLNMEPFKTFSEESVSRMAGSVLRKPKALIGDKGAK